MQSSFDVVGLWNEVFMSTVRKLRGQPLPKFPDVNCQKDDPDGYCYCEVDPINGKQLNPTCAGKYDPFKATGNGMLWPQSVRPLVQAGSLTKPLTRSNGGRVQRISPSSRRA